MTPTLLRHTAACAGLALLTASALAIGTEIADEKPVPVAP